MADLSPDKIIEPISDDQPCGPDLDMEFDMDFMNFMAEIDGLIPTRYFSFDPGSLDFNALFGQIDGFLGKTRDIRLLVPLAKLRILKGDVDGFIEVLVAIDALLKAHWADVHPQAADFLDLRTAQLGTLDDMPNSVLPLQHATLYRSRRAGSITLRKWQVASGDVSPREDEERPDPGTIMSELASADAAEMAGLIAKMERARDAINGIRTTCISEGGFDTAPTFEKLPETIEAIIAFVKQATGAETDSDAGEAAADGEGAASAGGAAGVMVKLPTGDVTTREAAMDALFAAEKYYALFETSSPIVLLLREARSASNKTFAELVKELLPGSAGSAFFAFGKEPWFEVPMSDIDYRNPAPDYEAEETGSDSSWEDAGLDDGPTDNDEPAKDDGDGWTSNSYGSDEGGEGEAADKAEAAAEPAADDGWTSSSYGEGTEESAAAAAETGGEAAAADGEIAEAAAAAAAEPAAGESAGGEAEQDAEASSARKKFVARTRPEALALIEKALAYYRLAEPSSPVALILERAIELSSKNFIGLLREVLPDGSLKVKPAPGETPSRGGWS